MRHVRPLLLALAVAVLAVACDRGGDQPDASPTAEATQAAATPSATAGAEVTTSPTPPAGPTPLPGSIEVPSTAVLIDARTGTATTLYRDTKQAAGAASFADGEVVVLAGSKSLRFRLDGSPGGGSVPSPVCRETGGVIEVNGRRIDGARCGSVSPDRLWMLYEVQTGEVEVGASGYRVPQHDMWVVNVQSGATTRLQTGLVHCGGCDGRYGPRWSPSSRYVAYAELGGQARRFLSDLTTGITRQIANGNQISEAPEWSPMRDVLVYSATRIRFGEDGPAARFEDLITGTSRDLPIPWPVRFDASGTYLYSPAWAVIPKSTYTFLTTSIVDAATGNLLDTLAGMAPEGFLWTGAKAVTRSGDGYLAVLQQAGPCAGTAIYRQGMSQPQCIVGGAQGQSAPDGSRVAVARKTGDVGPVHGPGFSSTSMPRFDIDIVDVATGNSRTVVTGAVSFTPPLMLWNAAGTHLLILWPQAGGL